MKHRRAQLRFDVVSDHGQIFVGESLCPDRIAGDEDGNIVDEGDSRFEGASGIETRGLLRSDRQIIDQNLGAGIFQLRDDLFARRLFLQWNKCSKRIVPLHVRAEAVENTAHFYDRSGEADLFAENFRAIGGREDGLANIKANLAAVDIKGGHDFDVPRTIGPDLAMHQTDPVAIGGGAPIKVYSLNQRAGTVTNTNNSDPDLSHGRRRKITRTEALEARVEFCNSQGEKARLRKKTSEFQRCATLLGGNFIEKISIA